MENERADKGIKNEMIFKKSHFGNFIMKKKVIRIFETIFQFSEEKMHSYLLEYTFVVQLRETIDLKFSPILNYSIQKNAKDIFKAFWFLILFIQAKSHQNISIFIASWNLLEGKFLNSAKRVPWWHPLRVAENYKPICA